MATSQRHDRLPVRGADKQAIVAFLGALTATGFGQTVPLAVPSGLPVGGSLHRDGAAPRPPKK